MELSVIIVTWNSASDLKACLASLAEGLAGMEYEIIVVDNASADGTTAMVKSLFPAVRLVENKSNSGFAAANNQGIALSRGEKLLLLNPDTLLPSGEIGKLLRFMDGDPAVGVAGPAFAQAPGLPFVARPWIYRFPGFKDELIADTFLDDLRNRAGRPAAGDGGAGTGLPAETDWVSGACMLVRRKAMESAGPLDERFFLYMEELEWCYRIKRAGWKVFMLPAAGIVHTGGTSSAKKDPAEVFGIYYDSRYKYFAKHWPAWRVLAVRVCKALLLGLTILAVALGLDFSGAGGSASRSGKLKAALRSVLKGGRG